MTNLSQVKDSIIQACNQAISHHTSHFSWSVPKNCTIPNIDTISSIAVEIIQHFGEWGWYVSVGSYELVAVQVGDSYRVTGAVNFQVQ